MRNSVNPECGFSLIEVMVAVGILSVGMAGAAVLLTTAMQAHRYSSETRNSEALALQKIEELKSWAVDASISDFTARDGHFSYKYSVTADEPMKTLDRVDVTVGWGGDRPNPSPICIGKKCSDDPDCCKRRMKVTNFVARPQPF